MIYANTKCQMQHDAYKHNINAKLSIFETESNTGLQCMNYVLINTRTLTLSKVFHNLIPNIWLEETLVLMTFSFQRITQI